MRKEKTGLIFHIISIICGVWFLLTGWIWSFLLAAFISYPIAIIGMLFWGFGSKYSDKLTTPILTLYFTALTISIISIFLYR
ncbi:hypothetical protein EDC17_102414 [Sphingobacterium alimentarium]|uniref:SPW repeat-containing protein n=1 Tax=Sphingobacterium alimentarium TaxID=797292 RepID=A0A4R3VSF9_9SPHI|nr:hypothetical protein [Sphingobacterium alimentarium]TCV12247.1 hypothetical protein EDC17_102414 [Sphingobacterium alimentarium]